MMKAVLSFVCLLAAAFPGIAQVKADYNLNFELLNKTTRLPDGWTFGNLTNATISSDSTADAYRVDSLTKENGKYALLIDWTKGYGSWTAINYKIKQSFKGDKVKLTGYVKTENITSGGLWMRLDGDNHKVIGFDNMQDRAIVGTTDWQKYSIELDYDESQVKTIVVGGLVLGSGKMWMDDLHVTIDDTDVSEAKINTDTVGKLGKYISDDSLMVTMRDTAQISVTVVRKRAVTEPQPVILMFGIYPGGANEFIARDCAARGYVAVQADTRGKRLSKEDIEPFEHDANDAYDLIDWISKQPWCNGKIGMYGGSYLGFAQWAAVKKLHPALKTIVPQVAVGAGIDFPTHLGVTMGYSLRWLHYVTNNRLIDGKDFEDTKKWDQVYSQWYKSGKAFNALDTLEGHPNKIFQRWLQHPCYDAYWAGMVPYKEEFERINIPILAISGYYDADQVGALYYLNQHHHYKPDNNDYFVIGPYDHSGAQAHPSNVVAGYTIDSVARINIQDLVFKWFDYVMKDSAKPALLKDRINFEVMGANQWRHVPSFSKMNNDTLTFYLGSTLTNNGYPLLTRPGTDAKTLKQEINLADRSDTANSSRDVLIDKINYADGNPNYLKFVSDPLTDTISINGSFVVNLITIINKKDMDIAIDLYEQQPSGQYLMLSKNVARCSLIKDRTKRHLLKPGKKETILFDRTFLTSRQLSKGSRIVLLIGVNKNKNYEINYGTGKDVSTETIKDAIQPLMIQWLTKGSYIKLPVYKTQ